MSGYHLTAEGAHALLLINRLERLVRLHDQYCGPKPDLNRLGVRLLERAIAATYQDCVDAGWPSSDLDYHLATYRPQQTERPQ